VAHPQKVARENGKLPVPRPDMISGSQHWWNKADNAITVWRDMENPTARTWRFTCRKSASSTSAGRGLWISSGKIKPEDERSDYAQVVVKAERSEEAEYDEKQAVMLDERIHGYGGLDDEYRKCIRTAYVNGGPREAQWYALSNCSTPGQFLERLQASLQFVSRFV
jgi:hypothetical protein